MMKGQLTLDGAHHVTSVAAERRRLGRVGKTLGASRAEYETALDKARRYAVEAYEAGLGGTEISTLLDVHRVTVQRWIAEYQRGKEA